ncbi:MAG: glycosyltransferase family 4 protein [Sedimentisphaerales bacterium]|nr:glycosyltransferase family 4 protein [Sedimentisphaerales bacterium]
MSSKRKNILYIQPNSEVGGSDIALLRLVESLDKERYCPTVLLPGNGPLVDLLKGTGSRVEFLEMLQLRTLPDVDYQFGYLGKFWPTVRQIARLIKRDNIDLVHTNSLFSLYGAWAAWLSGCAHLWHVREIPPAVPVAKRIFGKLVLKLSTRVVVMTGACHQGLFADMAVPNGKVVSLTDGLDLNRWRVDISGERIRRELSIGPEVPLVGFVARLDPWKGLDVFLKAAAIVAKQHDDARFLVSGGAPEGYENYEKEMQQLAVDLGLEGKVQFLGWRYRMDDILEVMSALSVFSHTSISPEPFGLVLIEAMSAARPVVAAAAGGPLEIVKDGETGFLTEPGNAEAHGEALCKLIADEQLRKQMGKAGRERVEQCYSMEVFARNLDEIYEGIFQ